MGTYIILASSSTDAYSSTSAIDEDGRKNGMEMVWRVLTIYCSGHTLTYSYKQYHGRTLTGRKDHIAGREDDENRDSDLTYKADDQLTMSKFYSYSSRAA